MATAEITSIFQEVLNENLPYCAICLRTGRERRLQESDTFVQCAKKIRLRPPVNKLLCYVCESSVRRAWRALHAVSFAATLNTWFQGVAARIKHVTDMKRDLERVTRFMSFGEGVALEAYWRSVRERSALVLTESLVVSSNAPDLPPAPEPAPPPPSQSPQPLSRNTDIENVVIIDDDDPPPTSPVPTIVPLETLLQEPKNNYYSLTADQQQIMTLNPNSSNSYVLYPIFEGVDQNLYVPYLNAKIIDSSLEFVDEKVIAQNVCQDVKVSMKENFIHYKGDTLKVNVYEKSTPALNLGEKEPPKGEEGGGTAKHAVMNDKVDWEDKIPMDVISFVDATDPNAEQFLHPPDPLANQESDQLITPDPLPRLTPIKHKPKTDNTMKLIANTLPNVPNTMPRLTPNTLCVTPNSIPSVTTNTMPLVLNANTLQQIPQEQLTLVLTPNMMTVPENSRTLRNRSLIKRPKRFKKPDCDDSEVIIDLC